MSDGSQGGRPQTPLCTVDVIIEMEGGGIVLVERLNPPHGWALPGGFVDMGETLAQAARREAKEETSLDVTLLEFFACYSEPNRDPRGHTVSAVFLARASGVPRAESDAKAVGVFRPDRMPAPMVFDHGTILADHFEYRTTGQRPSPER